MLIDLQTGLQNTAFDANIERPVSPATPETPAPDASEKNIQPPLSVFSTQFAASQYGQLILLSMARSGNESVEAYGTHFNKHYLDHVRKMERLGTYMNIALAQATLYENAVRYEESTRNTINALRDIMARREEIMEYTQNMVSQAETVFEITGNRRILQLSREIDRRMDMITGEESQKRLDDLENALHILQDRRMDYADAPSEEHASALVQAQQNVQTILDEIDSVMDPLMELFSELDAEIQAIKNNPDFEDNAELQEALEQIEASRSALTSIFSNYEELRASYEDGHQMAPEETMALFRSATHAVVTVRDGITALAENTPQSLRDNDSYAALQNILMEFHGESDFATMITMVTEQYQNTAIPLMLEDAENTRNTVLELQNRIASFQAEIAESQASLERVTAAREQTPEIRAVIESLDGRSRSDFINDTIMGENGWTDFLLFHGQNALDTIFGSENYKNNPDAHVQTADGDVVFQSGDTYYYYPGNDQSAERVTITDPSELTNILHQAWVGDPENGAPPKPFGNETVFKHGFENEDNFGLAKILLGGQDTDVAADQITKTLDALDRQTTDLFREIDNNATRLAEAEIQLAETENDLINAQSELTKQAKLLRVDQTLGLINEVPQEIEQALPTCVASEGFSLTALYNTIQSAKQEEQQPKTEPIAENQAPPAIEFELPTTRTL